MRYPLQPFHISSIPEALHHGHQRSGTNSHWGHSRYELHRAFRERQRRSCHATWRRLGRHRREEACVCAENLPQCVRSIYSLWIVGKLICGYFPCSVPFLRSLGLIEQMSRKPTSLAWQRLFGWQLDAYSNAMRGIFMSRRGNSCSSRYFIALLVLFIGEIFILLKIRHTDFFS